MKKKMCLLLVSLMLLLIPSLQGNAKSYKEGAYACKKGRYIYYSIPTECTGIIRYDVKTKKKKKIFSCKIDGYDTPGFSDLSIRGNYIYCVWNRAMYGSGESFEVIYRISLDGKKCKKLGYGNNPVISGDTIVYNKVKILKNTYGWLDEYGRIQYEKYEVTIDTNKTYRMNLDGSNKRKNKTVKIKKISCSQGKENPTDAIKGYVYYIGNNGKSICRKKVKTNKRETVFTCSKVINYFCLHQHSMTKF